MGALIQKSVKVTSEMNVRIGELRKQTGYSENQFIVQSLQGTFDMIDNPSQAVLPKIVWLALGARSYEMAPPPLPAYRKPPVGRMSWW